ncbi:MAG: alpha/beta fold hydrolase [Alphaproteobacteria bacterium]|nr:alpha/beta fold hydrolase [Alphaproteobacteria bacterium]
MEPPRQSVIAAARRLSFREAGAGPPLILLHGIGSGSASWPEQFARFSGRHRVIAWDAPGYGESDLPESESPLAIDYATALRALVDRLGFGRFHLLGQSMGSVIAAAFARAWPERLVTLTLTGASGGLGRLDEAERAKAMQQRLGDMAADGPEAYAAKRSGTMLAEDASAEVRERARRVMAEIRPEGFARGARMLGRADSIADLVHVRVPALVMCGTADRITPEPGVRRIAGAIMGARYVPLAGGGHASYLDRAPAYNAALEAFLAENPG